MSLVPGQTLSQYEILAKLGQGAMGEVWCARDTRLDRQVAIKMLPEEMAQDRERLQRFEREARTLAKLNHPNVAGIHGIDEVDGTLFLAMEMVPSEDLQQRLARGPLPVSEAIGLCRQIAEGLAAAHEAGVIHRDLKPENVRITPDGVVKLLDFGLAKPTHADSPGQDPATAARDGVLLTSEGMILGTPTYMSPEQARGRWMPDGSAIVYLGLDDQGRTGLWIQDFRTDRDTLETRRPLVGFDGSQVHESFGIAPDGKRLILSTVEQVRTIQLADRLPSLR